MASIRRMRSIRAASDRQVNLEIANSVLGGARGPRRDIVVVNAAARRKVEALAGFRG